MDRVKGKVALVTGGAGGIGRATSRLLAVEGAKIAVTDLDEAGGTAVAAEITKAGGEAIFLRHDVTQEAEWERVIAAVKGRFGALNIVVNNAGVGISGNIEETSFELWRKIIAINLDSVFLGTKHGVLAMKEGVGSIINLSSIEGLVGDPNLAAYNASKGGVRLLSKSAALHCAKSGYKIRVNSVHPGYIWTPMVEKHVNSAPDPVAARAAVAAMHPVGHLGEAADIANGILYLASDESKFTTGSELVIDGGYTAQ